MRPLIALLLGCSLGFSPIWAAQTLDETLAALPLVDEARVGDADPGHHFTEVPAGCSRVDTRLDAACRALPPEGEAKGFAVRLGEGKLTPRGAYVLEVEFPEDAPRTFFIVNRGDDSARGVACGGSLCDGIQRFTQSNPESLDLPLSKRMRVWRGVFRLIDRFSDLQRKRQADTPEIAPENGFWVIVAQSEGARHPGSQGAAIASIRLRALEHPETLDLPIHAPPAPLPRRHLFWREEMADGVIEGDQPGKRGFVERLDWYADKARTMRFLGIDTFCKDLLEFGHNQGWDSAPHGGNDWVYQTPTPDLWERIVALMGKQGIPVLPYYEYCGSIGGHGLGPQKRAKPLNGKKDYTQISWTEQADADLTDPDTLDDFAKILDCTVFKLKDRAKFIGAWLRTRPSQLPVGFGDATIARFVAQANHGEPVTREHLAKDKALRERYLAWWFERRRDFLVGIRDRLKAAGIADPFVLFSPQTGEPVPAVEGDPLVVRGDTAPWKTLLAQLGEKRPVRSLDDLVATHDYAKALDAWPGTWGGWEWDHACPPADPRAYRDTPGVMIAYPFNRAYTVADPSAIAPYRSPAGLTMVRHHPLNEHLVPKELFGYLCADVEYAGEFCMLSEVLAMANGDPTCLAALTGTTLQRGFPSAVRDFDAAFLALPALPSTRLQPDPAPGVVVRRIDGGTAGTWFAVCNTGTEARPGVRIALPAGSTTAFDAATEQPLSVAEGAVAIDTAPCSLRALRCSR